MKNFCLIIILMTISPFGFSQNLLSGDIKDGDGNGVPFANVLLLNNQDSSLVKGAVSDEIGHFKISNFPSGTYLVNSYMVGYDKAYTTINFENSAEKKTIRTIKLVKSTTELDEVTVRAIKPLYEIEMGKMVVNVQSSVTSAGLSAIGVLERSPGVMVNRQNSSLALNGKNGVIVLFNGKRSRMPIEAVFQLLEGLNASDIETIEIMTVPPAKYDADGDAGFINIVMKRGNGAMGTNGTVMGNIGYGTGINTGTSIQINHQGKKFSFYGNYSLNYVEAKALWKNSRRNSTTTETVSSVNSADRFNTRTTQNFQAGVDYHISKKTILSALVGGYFNHYNLHAPTTSFYDYSNSPDTLINSVMDEKNHWKHVMGNINLQHSFGKNQVLNFNLDYLIYDNENPSQYDNQYYSESDDFIKQEELRIEKNTPIKIWVGKIDHSFKINKSITLESGIKGTLSELENDVIIEDKIGEDWVIDPQLSNYSNLTEDIWAAFTSVKFKLGSKTMINAGLRYEHTLTNLSTPEEENLVNRNYGNIFPTLFISEKLNENSTLQFSYGQRITRPTFNQMAPFIVFLDPYTFFSGNVNILPTITNNLKADYIYKNFIFSLQYSHDKNAIMRFQPTVDPETNTLVFTSDNIDYRQTYSTTISLPFEVNTWWEMQNNLSANWQFIDTELDGENYKRGQGGMNVNTTQTFKLPKDYTIELMAFYIPPVINGYFNWLGRGSVNLGVQKEFGNGTLRIACNDIFETTKLQWETFDDASFYLRGSMKWNKRIYAITYTQKFGNQKIKGTRKRAVGSKEEQKRVSN